MRIGALVGETDEKQVPATETILSEVKQGIIDLKRILEV